jgi:TusA-related sulfurtransferase
MKEIDVTGLQCTQAVMAVLREIISMQENEEMHITYEEPNARRDVLAMVKRRKYNINKDDEKLLIISK